VRLKNAKKAGTNEHALFTWWRIRKEEIVYARVRHVVRKRYYERKGSRGKSWKVEERLRERATEWTTSAARRRRRTARRTGTMAGRRERMQFWGKLRNADGKLNGELCARVTAGKNSLFGKFTFWIRSPGTGYLTFL